jgi:thiol-disulfide isomerase/thioredoxin
MSQKVRLASGLFGVIAIILIALAFVSNDGDHASPPLAGWMKNFTPTTSPAPAPPFSFQDPKLKSFGLSDFKGRLVLVNFWATWCGPCIREMPTLLNLQKKLGGKDFQVIALSEDRKGWPVITPFLTENNLTDLPVFYDPRGKASRALGVKGLPTTILFDRSGRELGRLAGVAEWDADEVLALIRYYSEAG